MTLAVVAMGSNLSPRRETLRQALTDLARLADTRLLRASRHRETTPVDAPAGSPHFYNGACLLETTSPPLQLLEALLAIEVRHGRIREAANAPRSLDLDLILYGEEILSLPGLDLPHPRAHLRSFVLEPCAEVAPDMVHPLLGASLSELFDRLAAPPSSSTERP
ncbi:MAG: 2-amino-4-hydroxy-6-hydroxymethyldihydropteridine diphosphokinase [Pseudohongiellaceae bacterium]|jgi:2-amino-4-hydroxy-6-hydroxymethyldihydropteridine diphosphokinase